MAQNSGDIVYEIDESSVPAQVQVVNCRNAIELEFGHQRNPVLPMMACVVFGIVLIAIGAIVYDGVGLIVCGSIFISITVFVLLVLQFTSVRLSITSHSINEVHIYPRGSSVLQELPTENIFELYLADRYDGIKGDGNLALHIAGEEGEMVVGRGLPRETLEWIKECVLCVIAGDDEPE